MPERKTYDSKLKNIYEEIVTMGVRVKEALQKAELAIANTDGQLAQEVIDGDSAINSQERDLEDKIISLIALEQPYAHDLRKMVAALKIIAHLERLADHGVHICRRVNSSIELPGSYIKHFEVMLVHVVRMIDDALTAFIHDDTLLAKSVAGYDSIIDEEYDKIYHKIITDENSEITNESLTAIMIMARYLERSGDHITHICEWIIYAADCTHVELND